MDIQIRLPARNLADLPTLQAAYDAFGITYRDLEHARDRDIDLQVRCTDAQFGQFIAKRVVGGCSNNQIRVFNVRILNEHCVPPSPRFNPNFDVRSR